VEVIMSPDVGGDDAGAPESADAFTSWVEPHWHAMAVLARRMVDGIEWEDTLQDALSAAWRSRASFDPSRGSARAWLLAITANRARTARTRLVPLPVDDVPDRADESTTWRDLDLEQAISQLPDRQRTAVSLFYFVGLPVAEVASVMGCAEGTVKSTLADARTRLRTLMGAEYR